MADHLNNKPYGAWIAIDIAKDFHAVLSETKEGKRQHFRMANSASDHAASFLISELCLRLV